MQAVAMYLEAVRDGQKLSRAKFAAQIDTTENTIYRIESGRQVPEAPMLVRIVTGLGASWGDVTRLMLDEKATQADAIAAANRLLEDNGLGARVDALFEGLTDEQADVVIRAMLERPRPAPLLAAFRAWWDRMRA